MVPAWNRQEMFKLIKIWGEDRVQEQLEGCHRNREVYVRIARKMAESAGYERTFCTMQRKNQKKFKKEYRRIRDLLNEIGNGREEEAEWPYFDAMDRILSHKPSSGPEVVVDSLAQSQSMDNSTCEAHEDPEDSKEDETQCDESSGAGANTSSSGTSLNASHVKKKVKEEEAVKGRAV